MWRPSITRDTREDKPEAMHRLPPLLRLWTEFLVLMATLGLAGLVLEPAATTISAEAGLSQTVVGVLLTAISTSIPELVTSVAAVRRGALTLAVGGIIGGNAFDTLFMAASDIAYRDGSIYHTMSADMERWVTLTLLMAAILIMGLIRRGTVWRRANRRRERGDHGALRPGRRVDVLRLTERKVGWSYGNCGSLSI